MSFVGSPDLSGLAPRAVISRRIGLWLLVLFTVSASLPAGISPDPLRLAPGIQDDLETEGRAEGLVLLRNRFPLSGPSAGENPRLHRRRLVRFLRSVATTDQAELLETLERRGVEYRSFWIVNMVWVRATEADFREILSRPEVDRVLANPEIPLRRPPLPKASALEGIASSASDVEPALERIGAPRLWDSGILGQGITVGIADTGVDWDHPALQHAYAGWDGSDASHDYHWWDTVHSGGGACGPDSPEPCDDYNHGTHVAGTVVGDDGGPPGSRNRIGVAPGARWIACRNMDRGVGTVARYAECLQFFLAPTDREGDDPDPDRAPEIVNNSWICEVDEGCDDPVVLREAVEAVRAAGILFVSAAGNKGPGCGTLDRPPSIYSASVTVTAVDPLDRVAISASRGPGVFPDLLKPDLGAPGTSVRSAFVGGDYGRMSGTSMASPHVTGGAALLLSACPELVGDPRSVASRLRASTIFLESPQECGGIPGSHRPNPVAGWGSLRLPIPGAGLCAPIVDGEPGFLVLDRQVHTVPEAEGRVVIAVARRGGNTGAVSVGYSTIDGTATSPEDYDAVQGTVSWEPGETSPREIVIPLVDDGPDEIFESFRLVLSEPTGGATIGSPATTTVQIVEPGSGSCVEDEITLCLQDDRFELRAAFRTFGGDAGVGRADELTSDTGTFWFFDRDNVEIVAKVLDACPTAFRSFWVYAGGLTDQGVTLLARDTETDALKLYSSPVGEPFALIRDTAAFSTCP